ncbi:uncharacterized protein BCR38DRAFT_409677 [Pseudomassariella vexata]|uniref:AGC-kinase C-terminal domain-containing protein n=1 Tax=Pseudomassariella vexata TaxID=1141098 RepID=A0A1Y2DYF4_9PEZI|nr:uncharacterized protein BCR38DRAFT_409677 [Pseudomassariella vexata]ORY64301.1 hypothetical protein BCR38DRAFT_409677 [Pseudomassariella vexata]
MLSHLRFHRRAPSTPTSPIPENGLWDSSAIQPPQLIPDEGVPSPDIEPRVSIGVPLTGHGKPQSQQQQQQQRQSQLAPTLPPIRRVSSADDESAIDLKASESRPQARTHHNDDLGFLGGLALQNYRNGQDAMRPGPTDYQDGQSYKPDSSVTSPASRPPMWPNKSFVAPTDLRVGSAGKRQPGAGIHTELQGMPVHSMAQEPSRGRKSLPFLKNPMSTLLMRRKTSQNVPDLSLELRKEPSYEPIRGTRVHDFSAPRPRRIVSSIEVSNKGTGKALVKTFSSPVAEVPEPPAPPVPPKDEPAPLAPSIQSSLSTAASADSTSFTKPFDETSQAASDGLSGKSSRRDKDVNRRKSSIPASISSLSRKSSTMSGRDAFSSLPKHMKSTSSRFSFDMIGAAKAEKLLEESYRRKQQDKRPNSFVQRDSRFDDFDEDAFDYDAMDYDDGLEERIPGVNADYDDEEDFETELDPDNDQENFAGFVFQRSESMSAQPSSAVQPIPQDAAGDVIGRATTGEAADARGPEIDSLDLPGLTSLAKSPTWSPAQDSPTGLGIQGLDETIENPSQLSPTNGQEETGSGLPNKGDEIAPTLPTKDDELYFGNHEFEGEGDGTAFDESLFDLDDTDQYGRPIPGMFANALAQRMAAQELEKRNSDDVTSRLSAQSGFSQSTARTSLLSLGKTQKDLASPKEPVPPVPAFPAPEEDNMAAYQAALAAAAHKAAATGKFRRDSDLQPPADVTITSPTTSGSDMSQNNIDSADDYEFDGGFSTGLDDYELDDDAIIAEANASALANDSDGWYGQEFGFYSAPAPQHQPHHGPEPLSEQNLFHYSNGGYFGPSGVARTKSGHLVSREPNLTPITERSEYSNRNSIMSFTLPNGGNRDASLQSPGLAQLAMMADDDNMSLSALIRLRSKAWGGSQVSLASSREGSPSDKNGAASPLACGQESRELLGVAGPPNHGRKNSAFSLWSQDSGAGSGSGSPTLTMSTAAIPNNAILPPLNASSSSTSNSGTSPVPAPLFSPPPPSAASFPPVIEDEESDTVEMSTSMSNSDMWTKYSSSSDPMSPVVGVPSQKRPGMGHRHKGSADSVSYTKEEDSGETRWVMERRRTAESGEIEILGREVLEGGRI